MMAKKKKSSWALSWLPTGGVGERMFTHLPYIAFLSALALVMVYNVHRAQGTLRAIEQTRTELREQRWHATALQSEIMYENKQSEVLRRMSDYQLGLAGTSPRRLVDARDE